MNKNIQLCAVINFCAAIMIELNLPANKAIDKMKKTFSLSEEDTSTVAKCIVEKVLHLSYDVAPGGVNFLDDNGKSINPDIDVLMNVCYECKKADIYKTITSTDEPRLNNLNAELVLEVIEEYLNNLYS